MQEKFSRLVRMETLAKQHAWKKFPSFAKQASHFEDTKISPAEVQNLIYTGSRDLESLLNFLLAFIATRRNLGTGKKKTSADRETCSDSAVAGCGEEQRTDNLRKHQRHFIMHIKRKHTHTHTHTHTHSHTHTHTHTHTHAHTNLIERQDMTRVKRGERLLYTGYPIGLHKSSWTSLRPDRRGLKLSRATPRWML